MAQCELSFSVLRTKVTVKESMRLIYAFFVFITISTTALACIGSVEPGFDRMIKDSTLIVRGQVLHESGDKQWNSQGWRQHISDVLIERTYKGVAPSVTRVSWKDYFGCPRARLEKALLKLHDYSALEAAGRLVETVPDSRSFVLPAQEAASLRTRIGSEIMRIEEPSQLSVLQRFTLSSNSWLRQNAAYALRHLHDFSNVRYLIRLIDDPSEETRIQAMLGLQELIRPGIDGYGWVHATPLNGRNVAEEEVIGRWRTWWQAEGESRYGK